MTERVAYFFSALTSFYSRASFSGCKCILMWFGLCRERESCLPAFFSVVVMLLFVCDNGPFLQLCSFQIYWPKSKNMNEFRILLYVFKLMFLNGFSSVFFCEFDDEYSTYFTNKITNSIRLVFTSFRMWHSLNVKVFLHKSALFRPDVCNK